MISIVVAAVAGSTAGYVSHQVLSRKEDPAANPPLVVGAPVTVMLLATALGSLAGRRGPLIGFVAGLLAATLLGTRLDDAIPGVSDARKRSIERLSHREAA